MRMRPDKLAISAVCILFSVASHAAPVLTDINFNLSDLSGWTQQGTGGLVVGTTISTSGDTRWYTRRDIPLADGEAFLFEAAMSGSVTGNAGELGARLWATFLDQSAPIIPPPPSKQTRRVEARLMENIDGSLYYALFDGMDNTEKASINVPWMQVVPQNVVRLRRQLVNQESLIFLEVLSMSNLFSVSVPLQSFNTGENSGDEFGFGHIISGIYQTNWERLRLIRSNEADTFLPTSEVPIPPTFYMFFAGLVFFSFFWRIQRGCIGRVTSIDC